ncbi:MAG: hypothetical protein MUE50_18970, partial [Pirellulaceae bacterium]|nr:hypothetical protein [Pirellulaceae bacterium]
PGSRRTPREPTLKGLYPARRHGTTVVAPRWGADHTFRGTVTQGGAASPPLTLGYGVKPLRG